MKNRRNRILAAMGIAALVLAADGCKSYAVARRYIAKRYPAATRVRVRTIYFVGIWQVGFNLDAWHQDAWIQVRVAPLWPAALGHTSCR